MDPQESWLLEEKHNGEKTSSFFTDCEQLRTGVPLAYLIGHTPFLNCKIYLDSHPLIPRPETEFWVEKAIKEMCTAKSRVKPLSVLDLCAGSGCIGVSVAKAIPKTKVDFAEIDTAHHATIKKNIEQNPSPRAALGLGDRYRIYGGDLFGLIQKNISYDFILSNPPYIDPELDRAEASVKDNEPNIALYGGTDGVECISSIIATSSSYLNEGGQLWIEHEPEQTNLISKLAKENNFLCTTEKDQYNIERYSILVLQ